LVIIGVQVALGNANALEPTDPAGVVAINYGLRRDEIRFSAFMLTAGVFFLFWFLAALRSRLEQAEGDDKGWLPSVAYGAGLTAGALPLMLASFGFAGSVVGDYEGDWQVPKTLLMLTWDHLIVIAPALAALVAVTSIVSIRSGALPAWLGWLSILLVLAPVLVAPELMTIIFLVWVIVVSLVMLYQTFTEHGPNLSK
jgi:hypothetical protein